MSRVINRKATAMSFGNGALTRLFSQPGVREAGALVFASLALYLVAALSSYSSADPGWSVNGPVAVANSVGRFGAVGADLLLSGIGYVAYGLPVLMLWAAWNMVRPQPVAELLQSGPTPLALRIGAVVVLLLALVVLCTLHSVRRPDLPAGGGGIFGDALAHLALPNLGLFGTTLIAMGSVIVGAGVGFGVSWLGVLELLGRGVRAAFALMLAAGRRFAAVMTARRIRRAAARDAQASNSEPSIDFLDDDTDDDAPTARVRAPAAAPAGDARAQPLLRRAAEAARAQAQTAAAREAPKLIPAAPKAQESARAIAERQQELFMRPRTEGLPALSLLDEAEPRNGRGYSAADLETMSRLLEVKLLDFGVEVLVVAVQPGPVITRFELQLAAGVKVSRISSLVKDLARSLAVISVRVVEVIPGRAVVGIEIPNEDRETVRLREILSTQAYERAESALTMALGKDIAGAPMFADLSRMPHLLVAGTTGSGKSVGVNAMLLSLLFKATPEQLRLILIDPKMLELSVYDGIPHLLTPVVTDMRDAAAALRWCVAEMDRRYQLMAALGVRNLASFNKKVQASRDKGTPIPDPLYKGGEVRELSSLPFIVVVVDEFADMMMIVGKKVEELIARIAQKARASGIHLLLATQRPSVDVITGLIKANIPGRLSFQVSSKIDSRTILDQGGAEQLLGHGDMLFLPPGTSLPVRIHGAFVSDDEVHRVTDDWRTRGEPNYLPSITADADDAAAGADGEGGDAEQEDELYDEAVAFVLDSRRASISAVQRRLRIGYNRAARLIEAMEVAGVVSSMSTSGAREVLVPDRTE